jgi:NADP-dependent 3-hydroxy acid dehydrogenase YdfG
MQVEGAVVLMPCIGSEIDIAAARALLERGAQVAVPKFPFQQRPITLKDAVITSQLAELCNSTDIDIPPEAYVASAIERFGRVDVLLMKAGVPNVSPFDTNPMSTYLANLEAVQVPALRVLQAALPAMRQQGGGVIVILCCVDAIDPKWRQRVDAPHQSTIHLTNALRAEIRDDPIRICVLYHHLTSGLDAMLGPGSKREARRPRGGFVLGEQSIADVMATKILRSIESGEGDTSAPDCSMRFGGEMG